MSLKTARSNLKKLGCHEYGTCCRILILETDAIGDSKLRVTYITARKCSREISSVMKFVTRVNFTMWRILRREDFKWQSS